jgi:photosystem II stability/assembly factor-like uncharacterized protein
MSDDEARIKAAFGRLELPEAPERLHRRLADVATAQPPRRRAGRLSAVAGAIASAAVLLLVGLEVVGPGTLPSATPSAPGVELARYDTGAFSFAYPAVWRTFAYHVESSFSHTLVYLATVAVPEPCQTTQASGLTRVACQNRWTLGPDDVVVVVSAGGRPGFDIANVPPGAATLTVDGQPGFAQKGTAPTGDPTWTWTFADPGVPNNFFTVAATYRGPDTGRLSDELFALVTSIRFDRPAVASPSPTASPAGASIDNFGVAPLGAIWTVSGQVLSVSGDAGATWQHSVLPPSGVPGDRSAPFVLDARHAWVVTVTPGSSDSGNGPTFDHTHLVVERTSDGGRTWQAASVPGDYPDSARSIVFSDADHGYLMVSGGRSNQGSSTVLRTDDGGATWAIAATVPAWSTGDLGSQIALSAPTTIWAGAQGEAGPVNHPILAVSRDGGRTWADAHLPLLDRWGGTQSTPLGPPVFLDPSTGFIAVETSDPSATGDATGNSSTFLYSTRDGGRTWSLDRKLALGANGFAFLSATHWVLLEAGLPGKLEVTDDAGATWREIQPPFDHIGSIIQIAPNGSRHLVGVLAEGGNSTSPEWLVGSSDGGDTWTLLPVPLAACRTADLSITVTNTMAAAGTIGGYLRFVNTTSVACTLQGAPTLTAVTADGTAAQAQVNAVVAPRSPTCRGRRSSSCNQETRRSPPTVGAISRAAVRPARPRTTPSRWPQRATPPASPSRRSTRGSVRTNPRAWG